MRENVERELFGVGTVAAVNFAEPLPESCLNSSSGWYDIQYPIQRAASASSQWMNAVPVLLCRNLSASENSMSSASLVPFLPVAEQSIQRISKAR